MSKVVPNDAQEAETLLGFYNEAKGTDLAGQLETDVLSANPDVYSKDDAGNWSLKSDASYASNAAAPSSDGPSAQAVETAAGFPYRDQHGVQVLDQSIPNQNLPAFATEPGTEPLPGVTAGGQIITGANSSEPAVNQGSTAGNADGTTYTGNMSASPNSAANVTSVIVPEAGVTQSEAEHTAETLQQANNAQAAQDAGVTAPPAPAETVAVGEETHPEEAAQAEKTPDQLAANPDLNNGESTPVTAPEQSTQEQPAPAAEPTVEPIQEQAAPNDDDQAPPAEASQSGEPTAEVPTSAPAPANGEFYTDEEKALYANYDKERSEADKAFDDIRKYDETH